MIDETQLRLIRSSRAEPPQRAASDPKRQAIYGAALEQFEQLLRASEAVGPAARPLPLFYALSQAGRAIVAARGDEPSIRGHGLGEDTAHEPPDLLHRRIERRSRNSDAFGAVSRAIGSPDFTGAVELGAIWVALPNTFRTPPASWKPDWRAAIEVIDETSYRAKEGEVQVQALSMSGNPHHDEKNTLIRERYPALPADTKIGLKGGSDELGKGNWIVVLTWDEKSSLDEVVPELSYGTKDRHLLPTLPGQDIHINELMLWWLLIYGLSIFARYHPELWAAALRVDQSTLAVPLEGLLDRALTAVPALVHEQLWK
jgi:hypothetical protein